MQIENTLMRIMNRHHVNATDMIYLYLFKGKQLFLFLLKDPIEKFIVEGLA